MTTRTDAPYHEDHLRRLLDQRTARADLHGRFPSVSEISDSPSIYSHAPFSPMPIERADVDFQSANYVISTHDRRPSEPLSPRSVMSDRQRLNIPHASSLDLDDDPRSSYAGTDIVDDDDASTQEGDNEDDGELHRVSAYGPKMIVHSRAPWETGEDDIEESGEVDGSSKRGGFKFSKGESSKKSKGLSGRAVHDSKPSNDSSRSQSKPKQSFDTVSSNISAGGALLALAQASMSSTSLVISQTSSPQTSLRDKLPLPRFRSRTPSNTNKADLLDSRSPRPNVVSPSPHSSPASHFRALSPTGPDFYRQDVRPSYVEPSPPHTPHRQEYHHPYANPDLVRKFAREISPARRLEELHALASSVPHSPVVPQSESTATLTESATSSTITTTQSRSDDTISLTPGTSMSSVPTQNDFSPTARSFAKGISAPIPIERASPMPGQRSSDDSGGQASSAGSKREHGFPPIAGWTENTGAAAIKLISLEEAQAQARERSRSATVNGTPMTAPPISGPSRVVEVRQVGQIISGRSRMRTASASGARMKGLASSSTLDLHSTSDMAGDMSAVPQKTIGRKKSGFMRLFNGKEKVQSPPPVPSFSMDLLPPTPPPFSSQRSRKQSSHRVPVPSLTPSLFVDAEGNSNGPSDSRSDAEGTGPSHSSPPSSATGPRPKQLSVRRNAPGLSIITHPPADTLGRAIESGLTPTTGATDMTFNSAMSASPDPRMTGFIGLSLRPMSTMFSSDLQGQINSAGSEGGRPSLDSDTGTPTTNTTAISPRSPDFSLRSEPCIRTDKDDSPPAVLREDQASVIQKLEAEILNARRAWQRQVWELEGQVRDLKAEVEDLRSGESAQDYCSACGRGSMGRPTEDDTSIDDLRKAGVKVGGVVNRPRARTGVGSRFASGI